VPEQPRNGSDGPVEAPASNLPDSPSDLLLEGEREHFGEVAGDAGLIGVAAVAAGSEGRRTRKGLGFGAWFAILWMVFIVGIAVLAKTEVITWGDPFESNGECARKGPFADEGSADGVLLGCDGNGRDMTARLALGAWTSMLVATGAILVGFFVGGSLGLLAGFFGTETHRVVSSVMGGLIGLVIGLAAGYAFEWSLVLTGLAGLAVGAAIGWSVGNVDTIITGMFNVFLAVPAVILALSLVAFLQGSPDEAATSSTPAELLLIIAIGVVSIPLVGRISRASAISWAQREFVLAARAQGAKNGRIMIKEVLPNVAPAMFSIALLGIAIAIVAEGALAILGVGVKPPTPSWGNIIAYERTNFFRSPHMIFEPAILIFFTVLSLNFLGDVVRARFDVREGGI
jgi:peptide/nickel transport system permease protein